VPTPRAIVPCTAHDADRPCPRHAVLQGVVDDHVELFCVDHALARFTRASLVATLRATAPEGAACGLCGAPSARVAYSVDPRVPRAGQ
jgi:hypothetical protein